MANRGRAPGSARPAASILLALTVAPGAGWAASFPPHLEFRTLEGARVVLHFHQGLEPMARQALPMAEEILAAHEARYGLVVPRVQIVLADTSDDPNGFASPLPYPLVHLRAAAPDGTDEFGNLESWLRLVLVHELAHVVHLEPARGLLGVGRKLFGRAPFLFPNSLTPVWMIEGLATYEETEGTAFGRGRNADSRMVLRMAALEDDFPAEDRPASFMDRWPSGHAPYLFGEAFMRDLTVRFGRRTLPELARVHSSRVVPFLDDLTAHRVTEGTFHGRWKEWRLAAHLTFEGEAEEIAARGLTRSRPLTDRGVRQEAPRFSPDGRWIAYTSRGLSRYTSIRLMRSDGTGDRRVADRNGGSAVAWTPDGNALVYDEPEVHRLFAVHSDLRVVEVSTGRVRRLTRGLRAAEPDVGPDGRVVFVRRFQDRSELWTVGLDGERLEALAASDPETQWSGPDWSPSGDRVAAARWTPGGWLDLVLVDAETGGLTELTRDRARDVEPTWTPDGEHVVFRSDRDGVSNLYALRLSDRALLRITNVLGGAFAPSVSADGRSVAFASYTSRGYDVHVAELDLASAPEADRFVDGYPEPTLRPEPALTPARPYRPFPVALPRFWSPYAAKTSREWQAGVVTGGADPLLRHVWGVDAHWGAESRKASLQGFYQYDRFRPTFLLTAREVWSPEEAGLERTREVALRATVPLALFYRGSQSASLAWRLKRETFDAPGRPPDVLDLGGLEAAWSYSTARQFPYSISPVEGWRLRLAYLKEDPALGSDVSLGKATADLRAYARVFGEADTIAARVGGGATFGRPAFQRSFAVGGFPDASLFDVVATNLAVLRGYPDDAFRGRSFVQANVEYRVPLGHPQRGYRSLPLFLRHLHATAFADAAHAWSGAFRMADVKTSAGLAVGGDLFLGRAFPVTATLGLARGFGRRGETQVYLRTGLAF